MTATPPPATSPAAAPAKKPLGQIVVRRTVIGLLAMLLLLVPSLVLFAITKQPVTTYASMGTLIGLIAIMAGGVRIGVIVSIVTALLAPIAVVAGLAPVTGAALMALMALTVGRMSRYGLHRAVMLVPVFLAWPLLTPIPWLPTSLLTRIDDLLSRFGWSLAKTLNFANAHPGHGAHKSSGAVSHAVTDALVHQRYDNHYLAWVALVFFVGAIIPVLLMPFALRKIHLPAPTPHSRAEAMPYTITITVLTAAGTYYFLDHPKQTGGSFYIAAVLVLAQVGTDVQWKLTVERVLGTVGGLLVLGATMAILGGNHYTQIWDVPVPASIYLVGIVFGMAAIIAKFSPRQWIYYIFITPTAACLNAFTTTQAGDLGKQRLADNAVGALLVILAALITLGASRIAAKHHADGQETTPAVAP